MMMEKPVSLFYADQTLLNKYVDSIFYANELLVLFSSFVSVSTRWVVILDYENIGNCCGIKQFRYFYNFSMLNFFFFFVKIGAIILASTDPCSAYVICTPAKPPSGHNKPVNSVPFHGDYSSAILFPASSLTVTQTNSTSLPSATCLSKGIFEKFRLKYRFIYF